MTPFSRLASFTSERLAKLASANYMIYSVIYGGRGGGGNQVGLAIHQLSEVFSLVMFSSCSPQSKCSWTFLKNSGGGHGGCSHQVSDATFLKLIFRSNCTQVVSGILVIANTNTVPAFFPESPFTRGWSSETQGAMTSFCRCPFKHPARSRAVWKVWEQKKKKLEQGN